MTIPRRKAVGFLRGISMKLTPYLDEFQEW